MYRTDNRHAPFCWAVLSIPQAIIAANDPPHVVKDSAMAGLRQDWKIIYTSPSPTPAPQTTAARTSDAAHGPRAKPSPRAKPTVYTAT